MRVIFLTLFCGCFVAKSQTDSLTLNSDTCGYIASWPIIDRSSVFDSTYSVYIENIPPCNKSSCNVFVTTECETQEFHFIIYNRWGEIEYETTTPGNGWCAYNKVDGVYIWQIEGIYLSGKKFKFRGHFYLLKDTGEIE